MTSRLDSELKRGDVDMGMPIAHALTGINGMVATYRIHEIGSEQPALRAEARSGLDSGVASMTTRYWAIANATNLSGIETVRYLPESLATVSYYCEDHSIGEVAEVSIKDGKANVSYRPNTTAPVKYAELPWTPNTFVGSALPIVMAKHWAELREGKTVDFDLYVPFRLESVGFRLTRQADTPPNRIKIIAEARNWLIRQFAPSISFTFIDQNPPTMASFSGPAPVSLGGERHRPVTIDFTQSPQPVTV